LIKKGIGYNKNLEKIIGLIKERSTFIADFWEQGSYFFEAPNTYNEKAAKKAFKENTPQLLSKLVALFEEGVDFSSESLTNKTKNWITENEIGFGNVMMPLRLALVGEMKGPDVFEIAAILGKKEVISRINKVIAFLS
jgi:glutamyl-tRNA synthetase